MANLSPAEHSHGIDLESALDFLNTLHPGHGRTDEQHQRDEHLASPADAAMWFLEHELVHPDAGIRIGDNELARIRRVRSALREVVDSVVEGRTPEPDAVHLVNATLEARRPTRLELDGTALAHRPPPRRHAGRRRARTDRGGDHRGARHRPARATPRLRERPLPLGVLRLLADGPAPLVRHALVRQPGQGRPLPGAPQGRGEAGRGRRPPELAGELAAFSAARAGRARPRGSVALRTRSSPRTLT